MTQPFIHQNTRPRPIFTFLAAALLSVFAASAAEANVRAPTRTDGDVVITQLTAEAMDALTLKKQRLSITMPELVDKEFTPLKAQIEATYTFDNKAKALKVPMVFLATGIADATVSINGKPPITPTTGEMNDAQRAELVKAAGTYAPRPANRADQTVKGSTATFNLELEPGENVLTFRYAQDVRFDEVGTRYGGPTHEASKMALTYLLYPCHDWKKADDFNLDITLTMPDYRDDGWFWNTYWEPTIKFNVPMTPTYDKKRHQTQHTAQFNAYPADILHVAITRGPKR